MLWDWWQLPGFGLGLALRVEVCVGEELVLLGLGMSLVMG